MIALKNTTDKQIFYILKKSGGGINPYFDLTQLDVEFTENGQYSILPPTGYDGLSKVNVTVDVAGSCNLTTSTATITESGEHTITPPTGYDGFTEVTVNVDTSTAYNEGKQDGIDEQKSKLASVTFTENGTYNREDGWNAVTVNVDTQTPYDNGFADGEDAQKAKLSSLNVTANGTYSREDGYNEVTVAVPSVNNQNKAVNPSTTPQIISADSGYSGLGQVTVNAVTASIDPDIQSSNILEGVNILGVEGSDRGYDAGYSEGYIDGAASCPPPPTSEQATVTYTQNGEYSITPESSDYLTDAVVTVNVPSFPDLSVIGWATEDIQPIQNNINNYTSYTTARSITGSDVIFLPMMDFSSNPIVEFSQNPSLVAIPNWDTSNVTNMSNWFNGDLGLITIPLLDTSNVTNMSGMFDVGEFGAIGSYTINFRGLSRLPAIDTSSATDTSYMFRGCSRLNSLPTLDLSSCTNAESMFEGCSVSSYDLRNTSSITNMTMMFESSGVTSLSLDTSGCQNMTRMFSRSNLHNLAELDCSNVTNVYDMFWGVSYLETLGGLTNLGQSFTGNTVNYHKLNLSDSSSLTTTATHNVLDKLGTVSVTASVVFDPVVYDALDPDDIASATAKGWSVIS